jgi:hypothetical protein
MRGLNVLLVALPVSMIMENQQAKQWDRKQYHHYGSSEDTVDVEELNRYNQDKYLEG